MNVWAFYSFITKNRVFDLKITQYLVRKVSQRNNIFQLVPLPVNTLLQHIQTYILYSLRYIYIESETSKNVAFSDFTHLINKLYRIKWFETFYLGALSLYIIYYVLEMLYIYIHYIYIYMYIYIYIYIYFQKLRFLCKPSFTMLCPSLPCVHAFHGGDFWENLWRGVHGGTNDHIIGVARCIFQ